MLYISKGVVSDKGIGSEKMSVNRCGKVYLLGDASAQLWLAGSRTIQYATQRKLESLARDGLVETYPEGEDFVLSAYRILTNCILIPAKRQWPIIALNRKDRFLVQWMRKAGLNLTMAELCYLKEHKLRETSEYRGRENRQRLVEAIYTSDTIPDGYLESKMEKAHVMPDVTGSVLRLIKRGYIRVL